MQKYAKHFLAIISGGGLIISGAIMWLVTTFGFDWSRVPKYGIGDQIGSCGTWPFAIIGSFMLAVGLLLIFGSFFKLLSRE